MLCRIILPDWAKAKFPQLPKVQEGDFTEEQINAFNSQFYNIYYLPNFPSRYDSSTTVDGSHIDTFNYVSVDMDLKDGKYASKEAFIEAIGARADLVPSRIVDSGNGIHVYWKVQDLDAMSFLKLQRRMMRLFDTDEAVVKIFQLMRLPNTINTKYEDALKACEVLFESDAEYTCEELDKRLPPISPSDLSYCQRHYDTTYKIKDTKTSVDDKIPFKFAQLLRDNKEAKAIWSSPQDDRSASDFRLGHLMFANGFSRKEALSVLVNAAKALTRAPVHRLAYAEAIVDKIWTYEFGEDGAACNLSESVLDILNRGDKALKGDRFPGPRYLDATEHGFRLGQVMGLVAGSGVGKTAMALNMFMEFVKKNPDYVHFFVPLEQPANEIADRWKTMCGDNTNLHSKVHVMSNYAPDGSFRHLSLTEIKNYLLKFKAETGQSPGCVVIDHIGALKKKGADGENQGILEICHEMKAFAIHTNTFLVMQSQSSREKAGIGDLELNKDAAYGTVYFESYCDYLVTIWQPLKRCYSEEGCPTVTAFKFCKIRHKKAGSDEVSEDVCHLLYFDPEVERLRPLTQIETKSFEYWNNVATNIRKRDRRTDVIPYKSMLWMEAKDGDNQGTNKTVRAE